MSPFSPFTLADLVRQHGTSLWVYDVATITHRIDALRSFDEVRFAQMANSNTHILRLMKAQGVVVDSVSLGEVEPALAAGYQAGLHNGNAKIVFTADLLDRVTVARLVELGIVVNCGAIDMLEQLGAGSHDHPVWLRIIPGFGHGHSNKTNTGGEHGKHATWHTELARARERVRANGSALQGLHMHIGSGADYTNLQEVFGTMVELVKSVHAQGLDLQTISAGGGVSIPYSSGDAQIDTEHYFSLWHAARQTIAGILGYSVTLEIEPGRYLVAESGVLACEVRAVKMQGSMPFMLVDEGFSDLVRPAMYGSFHDMKIIHADGTAATGPLRDTVVAVPLCKSGDVLTQGEGGVTLQRSLPYATVGDLMVLHDAGAYGASMSSNYNTRPLISEGLIERNSARLIRHKQTVTELFALESV